MNLDTGLRTIKIPTKLLEQFIEEKIGQFGFKADDQVVTAKILNVPPDLMVKVRTKKEQEGEIITHNG